MSDDAITADNRAYLTEMAREFGVPDHLIEGLVGYAIDGLRPGSFLCACLANDLWSSAARADRQSRQGFLPISAFITECLPNSGVGSYANIDAFVKRRADERAAAKRDPADLDPAPPTTPDASYLDVRNPNGSHR